MKVVKEIVRRIRIFLEHGSRVWCNCCMINIKGRVRGGKVEARKKTDREGGCGIVERN